MVFSLVLSLLAANPYLDEGRRHFANLEFDAAVKALAVAVEQPGLSRAERREAFDSYAQSLLALDRRDEAVTAYKRLLTSDPTAPMPKAAPKVVDAFLVAKRAVLPPPAVKLEAVQAGEQVNVSVFDPWDVVKRVRWLELTADLSEGAPVKVVEQRFSVTPSPDAKKVLLDALGANDVLLAHHELELVPSAKSPSAPSSTLSPLTLAAIITAGVAAAIAITFFGLGWQARPPAFTDAAAINAWNGQRRNEATAAWSFTGLALAAGAFAGLSLAF